MKTTKRAKTAVPGENLVSARIAAEKTQEQAFTCEIAGILKSGGRKLYVIRKDDSDWTPIVEVITGPRTPALSTMRARFEALYHRPPRPKKPLTEGRAIIAYTYAVCEYEQNVQEMGYAGHSLAEWFVDWLLKTDDRFQRVKYQEVNL